MKNALEFKNSLTVSKIRKAVNQVYEYEFDINGETFYIYRVKAGMWCAYDAANSECYAYNNTRKDVVSDIISGLYYQYKHNL